MNGKQTDPTLDSGFFLEPQMAEVSRVGINTTTTVNRSNQAQISEENKNLINCYYYHHYSNGEKHST